MLIIDMPMPEKCEKCPLIFCCAEVQGITAGSFITAKHDGFFADFCPIKGELVRCGECYYKDEKRIMDEDALWCRKHHMYVTDDWFCSDGERK